MPVATRRRLETVAEIPHFASRSGLLSDVFRRAGDQSADVVTLDHATAVARVLHDTGFPEEIVALPVVRELLDAGRLSREEVERQLGPGTMELLDGAGFGRGEREGEPPDGGPLRALGREGAALVAAEMLVSVREPRDGEMAEERRRAFERALLELEEAYPELPLIDELRKELDPATEGKERAAIDDLRDPALYVNRELSWLEFNDRVLQIVESPATPLLERVRFCSIFANNLDEFFMVRVAGLHDQVDAGIDTRGPDGLAPGAILERIAARVREQSARQSRCFDQQLQPALEEHGIEIASWRSLGDDERRALGERFEREILPVLTPLAVGAARPFPYISNLSLSLAVHVREPETGDVTFARVKVPREAIPRLIPLERGTRFVMLEDVIAHNLEQLFPEMEIVSHSFFRVTRDADFTVSDEADDLLAAVETELRRRRFGEVVRLEIDAGMDEALRGELVAALRLNDDEIFEIDGPLDLRDLDQIADLPGHGGLRYAPWLPTTPPMFAFEHGKNADVFGAMRRRDLLVHHPYDSFSTTVQRFLEQAVHDPDVLAIKQTVYRTSDDSPLVPLLIEASEQGKQAVCVVELKARFDERANIRWARALEEAGVHVTYGIPGLKAHAKAILVVRREGDGIRHYVHIGTGNYNPHTARVYTDLGLFTTDPQIGSDVVQMFNFLTGFGRPSDYRRILLAPTHLRGAILDEIERTIEAHSEDAPARIVLKMNALVDQQCIRALYRASQAGVKVDLNIRGICCLVPGVPDVSDNIEVVSVVGRFLEHSRIFAFHRGDDSTVYIGSADLMPRNLDSRVELLTPVCDGGMREELTGVLEALLADNTNAWLMGRDGEWRAHARGDGERRDAHRELMLRHTMRAEQGPGKGATFLAGDSSRA